MSMGESLSIGKQLTVAWITIPAEKEFSKCAVMDYPIRSFYLQKISSTVEECESVVQCDGGLREYLKKQSELFFIALKNRLDFNKTRKVILKL